MVEPELAVDLQEARRYGERATRKLRDLAASRAVIESSYVEQAGEIKLWHDREVERLDTEAERIKLSLLPYVTALVEADPMGKRSVEFVAGRAGFRAGQPRLVVDDTDECMSWLAENDPDLIRVKRELDLAAIKARMADGERFPGVRLEAGETSYYVKTLAKQP